MAPLAVSAKPKASLLVSVVIPLATGEQEWQQLCQDFHFLPKGWQVIIVACQGDDIDEQWNKLATQFPHLSWQLHYGAPGRARQMNLGASHCQHPFIWFLHGDSRLTAHNIHALTQQLVEPNCQRLFYFDLLFFDKSSWLFKINEAGAKFRSNILGLPFGDQGFFMSKAIFFKLGGYDETAPFGEDHLLVWQAKLQGIAVKNCPSPLGTSARKYRQRGWGALTLRYQYLWPKQALPHFIHLLKSRLLK